MLPLSMLRIRSTPASTAASISEGSSVSMLTGRSTDDRTASTSPPTAPGLDFPASIPMSMMSAPSAS